MSKLIVPEHLAQEMRDEEARQNAALMGKLTLPDSLWLQQWADCQICGHTLSWTQEPMQIEPDMSNVHESLGYQGQWMFMKVKPITGQILGQQMQVQGLFWMCPYCSFPGNAYPDARFCGHCGAVRMPAVLRKEPDQTGEPMKKPRGWVRDPDAECTEFYQGYPDPAAECDTDGHHLCAECGWNRHRLADGGMAGSGEVPEPENPVPFSGHPAEDLRDALAKHVWNNVLPIDDDGD